MRQERQHGRKIRWKAIRAGAAGPSGGVRRAPPIVFQISNVSNLFRHVGDVNISFSINEDIGRCDARLAAQQSRGYPTPSFLPTELTLC